MKPWILFIVINVSFVLTSCNQKFSQDEQEVYNTLQAMFDAMTDRDSTRSSELLASSGWYHRLDVQNESIASVSFAAYSDSLAASDSIYREVMVEPTKVLVNGRVATLITSYEFYENNRLNHRGEEVFNFIKVNGEWKITSSVFTVEQ